MNLDVLENLKAELRRGTQVLAVLSQLDGTRYGYSLLQTLTEKNVQIEAGTLYPLLRRLESQNLLESVWDTSESRPRKYYRLSEEGNEVYHELKKEWQHLHEEMGLLLKGEEEHE